MEASVATPGQGAPAPGVQSPAGDQGAGQGQPTAAGKGEAAFNWGLFPDVPEEQRALLEPHLRNVQGHVTKLEGQYAPYKGLTEMVGPDQVENLTGFLTNYQNDPVSTVMGLVQQGIEDGSITAEQLQGFMPQPASPSGEPEGEQVPGWAQELQNRLAQYEQRDTQMAEQQQQQEQQQMLSDATTEIRTGLTQGGITEDQVSDDMIVAAIIASNGDAQAAQAMLNQMRQNFLSAFTNGKTGVSAPNVQGQLPTPTKSGRKGDSMAQAKQGAKQYLEHQAQMAG